MQLFGIIFIMKSKPNRDNLIPPDLKKHEALLDNGGWFGVTRNRIGKILDPSEVETDLVKSQRKMNDIIKHDKF